MTLSCPGGNCPMCLGTQCNACVVLRRQGGTPLDRCIHGPIERHVAISALEETVPNGEFETAVPRRARLITRELPPLLPRKIEIDLADADDAAAFLELVACVIRTRRRVVLTVE